MAPVVATHGCPPLRAIIPEVTSSDKSAPFTHLIDNQSSRLPAIEPIMTPLLNAPQGSCQVFLYQQIPCLPIITNESTTLIVVSTKITLKVAQALCFRSCDCKTIGSQIDSRLQQFLPVEFAVAFMCLHQTSHRARHSCCQMPIGTQPCDRAARTIEKHVAACSCGGLFPIIERSCCPVGLPNDHQSTPADIASPRIHNRYGKLYRHGSIHGITSPAHHLNPHKCGQRMWRYYCRRIDNHRFARVINSRSSHWR